MDIAGFLHMGFELFVENVIDLDLRPYKMAIVSPFINNGPPKSSLEQAFDHGSIIPRSHIRFEFLGSVAEIIRFKVKIVNKVIRDLNLEQEIDVRLDSSLINLSKLFFLLIFGPFQLFVEILFFPWIQFLRTDSIVMTTNNTLCM